MHARATLRSQALPHSELPCSQVRRHLRARVRDHYSRRHNPGEQSIDPAPPADLGLLQLALNPNRMSARGPQAPQLDINTVAAGGGSRLVFANGIFVVGPESVGAHPGPVCYKKGGQLAITDANLQLGRIVPSFFPKVRCRLRGLGGTTGCRSRVGDDPDRVGAEAMLVGIIGGAGGLAGIWVGRRPAMRRAWPAFRFTARACPRRNPCCADLWPQGERAPGRRGHRRSLRRRHARRQRARARRGCVPLGCGAALTHGHAVSHVATRPLGSQPKPLA